MSLYIEMKRLVRWFSCLMVCLVFFCTTLPASADDLTHRLGQGVLFATGLGAEVTYGDYGVNAGATVVSLPLFVALNPLETIDMSLELPMVFLSSRSGSGVVVSQSGGAGRGRGPGRTITSAITLATSSTVSEAGLGDISFTAGWTVVADDEQLPAIRPTLYLKAPTGDKERGLGTGTFEIGPGLSVSKWLGDVQLFAEGAYIFQDSNSIYQGKNYISYSLGGGLQATDRLFVSLYAKGSSARVDDGTAPVEGRLRLNFLQSRRVSWELYALAGFTDASPAAGGGVLMLYQF